MFPLVIFIYILAVLILLYPIVANKLAERNQMVVIESYEENIENVNEEDIQAERRRADNYNVSLYKHKVNIHIKVFRSTKLAKHSLPKSTNCWDNGLYRPTSNFPSQQSLPIVEYSYFTMDKIHF